MRVLLLSIVVLLILALAGLEVVASRTVLAEPLPLAAASEQCLAW
jgi:hypothetical protein